MHNGDLETVANITEQFHIFLSVFQVASEHFYYWLCGLEQFCLGETCLADITNESSNLIPCLSKALQHYEKGLANLKVGGQTQGLIWCRQMSSFSQRNNLIKKHIFLQKCAFIHFIYFSFSWMQILKPKKSIRFSAVSFHKKSLICYYLLEYIALALCTEIIWI